MEKQKFRLVIGNVERVDLTETQAMEIAWKYVHEIGGLWTMGFGPSQGEWWLEADVPGKAGVFCAPM